jgi:putative hydrolase of the HAD superfamily
MKPIFSMGRCYRDSIPTLRKLRKRGIRAAVISNTTWGSPASLWRGEVRRLGLDRYLDAVFFCRDVGWRKPAKPIFEYALTELGVDPRRCLFVGDDPRWDLRGPKKVGMEAILIDRQGIRLAIEVKRISRLDEIFGIL